MIWPSPPAEPRVALVQVISRPADAGVTVSGFGRLANWLTGADKGNEQLVKPFGLCLDEKDNLCLTDTGANVVSYFDRARKTWQRWGKVGAVRFISPVAIASRNGLFFVADSGRASVVVFNLKGRLQFEITNHLARPSGLTIVDNRLLVVDSQRHCVVSFDLTGRFLSEFGRRGSDVGEFNYPTHIAADETGHLFVTDSMNGRVQVFDAEGRFKNRIGAGGDAPGNFSRPKGVSVDSFGHVYVVDGLFDNLQIFDAEGRFLLNLGESGSNPGQFWLPNGIAISGRNEIFIADSYNRRVQVLQYIGQP
jgi:DNA-binding beta-propeller fold protein YncE